MARVAFAILGGGIAGTALASHLARRGQTVRLFEPRAPAAGATGRAGGIVTEQVWNDWDLEVVRESHREAAERLVSLEPCAYARRGFVRWTARPDYLDAVRSAALRLRSAGTRVELLDAPGLRALYPGGRWPDGAIGIHTPDDAWVTPSALAEAYLREATEAGARVVSGRAVPAPRCSGGVWAVGPPDESVEADRLVVAAGAWSKRLLVDLGHPLPLCPYRTQAALLRPTGPPEDPFPSGHDLDTDVYVRTELAGRILAGDGTELVEADPDRFAGSGDAGFLAHLAASLADPFPRWADAEVDSAWAGVCTATPDRRPLIGPVPGATGLFVITGFNGYGVMRAGGAAGRLARALEGEFQGRPDWTALEPTLPSRFSGPAVRFDPKPGFTLEGGDVPRF